MHWIYIAAVIATILLISWVVPKWQVRPYRSAAPEQRAELENEFRKTLAGLLTGLAVVFSLTFTWEQNQANRNAADRLERLTHQQIAAAEQDRLTRQMNAALEQFGDTLRIEAHLAGIFGLEQVAAQSPSDLMPVVRMLAAYVRDKRPLPSAPNSRLVCADTSKLPTNVQTSLDALRRLSWRVPDSIPRYNRITLRDSDLRNATLDSAWLHHAQFNGAWLVRSTFLDGTRLYRADFTEAALDRSFIGHAQRARFNRASLCNADLNGANLDSASFVGTNLSGANLSGASLIGAYFDGADLSRAQGLTVEQLSQAQVSSTTLLPPDLEEHFRTRRAESALQPGVRARSCACP